ncbi:MAG: enoyl-CoA hydratase/isomerase family protein [Chloroflexi bacterium]|nr:enoyl-CoA hydratase/isomerase family protein [Chloroflexota bacterium]
MTDIVSCDVDEGVAFVRMNREEKHNAFHRELSLAVFDTMTNLEADDEVRCIVLTGAGKAFSAGADMTEALASFESGGRGDGMAQAVVKVATLKTPTIAAVNGYAFGGGAALAISCDIRIASERASFRFPGASYGLVVGGSQLPRIVGGPKAKELILTARVIDAQEAERIGLVNQLVPHDQLEDAAWKMAREIAKQSPAAVRWSKAVIDAATTIEKGVALEIEANRELRGSPDNISRFRKATQRVAGGGNAPDNGAE